MRITPWLAEGEIEANGGAIARAILAHPARRSLSMSMASAIAEIASRDPARITSLECLLLRKALVAIDAAEIAAGMEIHT